MVDRCDDDHPINDKVKELVLTKAEFQQFCKENQQVMHDLQQAVVVFLAKNPNHDGHGKHDNRNMREPHLRGYNNQNRTPACDEDDNKDDEYEEDI